MQTSREKIIYWTLIAFSLTAIILAMLLPKAIDMRIVFPVVLLYRIAIEWFQAHSIGKRNIPSGVKAQLTFRHRTFHYVMAAFVILCLTGLLFTKQHFGVYAIIPLMNASEFWFGDLNLIRRKVPRYILTSDKIIVNNFNTTERNLTHLHSIRITGLFQVIRISFSEEYDIKIRKSHYTEAELAAFIQALLDAAPVEADVDHEVRAMLTAATITNRG